MSAAATILTDLFIMFLLAKLAGELFERLDQPAVIGELLVGIAIGPHALGWVGVPTPAMVEALHGQELAEEAMHITFEVIAELGVIILLFAKENFQPPEPGKGTSLKAMLRLAASPQILPLLMVVAAHFAGFWGLLLVAPVTATAVQVYKYARRTAKLENGNEPE